MTCPHCGAQVAPGGRFCNKCRKRVTAGPALTSAPPPQRAPGPPRVNGEGASSVSSFTRPPVVTLLAVLNLLGGLASLGAAALMIVAFLGDSGDAEGAAILAVFLMGFGLVGAVQIAAAVGLFRLQPWGRMLQLGLSGIGLLGIPCGTIISILILIYMLKPEVKTLFSGISPRRLPAAEVAGVERLSQGSGVVMVIVGVVVIFALVAGVGIFAAIAIPSLLRARVSANESGAIADVRTVSAGQQTYASANTGFGDSLECLAEPTRCIPGYPETAPNFLPAEKLESVRRGYVFTLVPGPAAPPDAVLSGEASPTSLSGWAYTAVPAEPGASGIRSFCVDASNMICTVGAGSPLDASGGVCPGYDSGCEPLM